MYHYIFLIIHGSKRLPNTPLCRGKMIFLICIEGRFIIGGKCYLSKSTGVPNEFYQRIKGKTNTALIDPLCRRNGTQEDYNNSNIVFATPFSCFSGQPLWTHSTLFHCVSYYAYNFYVAHNVPQPVTRHYLKTLIILVKANARSQAESRRNIC